MTTPEKRPGRPTNGGEPRPLTPFGATIAAALNARRDAMSPGPRNMADLARVVGVRASTLHLQLTGRRPMPAETAAAIRRALPSDRPKRGNPSRRDAAHDDGQKTRPLGMAPGV